MLNFKNIFFFYSFHAGLLIPVLLSLILPKLTIKNRLVLVPPT